MINFTVILPAFASLVGMFLRRQGQSRFGNFKKLFFFYYSTQILSNQTLTLKTATEFWGSNVAFVKTEVGEDPSTKFKCH